MTTVKNPMVAGDGDARHGTEGGYRNHQCRCPECTEAHRLITVRRRRERYADEPPEHGTNSAYTNWGCRCDRCSRAHTDARRQARQRRTPTDRGDGTVVVIALVAALWTLGLPLAWFVGIWSSR